MMLENCKIKILGYLYWATPKEIWSSIHEKIKQHWGWDGKTRCSFQQTYSLSLGRLLTAQIQYRNTNKGYEEIPL